MKSLISFGVMKFRWVYFFCGFFFIKGIGNGKVLLMILKVSFFKFGYRVDILLMLILKNI